MDKQRALELLTRSKPELQARFGATARGSDTSSSDIDILVAFDGPATSKRYFGVQFYLEDLLGCPIDLVTEKALAYTDDLDQAGFVASGLTYGTTLRHLELIGEAATQSPEPGRHHRCRLPQKDQHPGCRPAHPGRTAAPASA
jgi:predicted nucleotidyltransferase